MAIFPDTPQTLMAEMAAQATGERAEQWVQMFNLYAPAICEFARSLGAVADSEDIVQDVFAKLVTVFRSGSYRPEKGRFRNYLAAMVRNIVINNYYKAEARAAKRHVPLDSCPESAAAVSSETQAVLDTKWRLALRAAAVRHVLTKTALAQKSKDIYRAYVLNERPIGEVAAAFGVPSNAVSQVKTRVERMIADYEALFSDGMRPMECHSL